MRKYVCHLQRPHSLSPNAPNTAKLAVCCLNGSLAIQLKLWHLYCPFLGGDCKGYPYLKSKNLISKINKLTNK